MKCTVADTSACAGAGAVSSVHCAVCRVQCTVKIYQFKQDKSNLNLILKNNFSKTKNPSVLEKPIMRY